MKTRLTGGAEQISQYIAPQYVESYSIFCVYHLKYFTFR